MSNILKIFLSSILIASFTVTVAETLDKVFINLQEILPFYPDIKISNTANQTNRQEIDWGATPDKDIYTGTTEIKWTDYAYSWNQFKNIIKQFLYLLLDMLMPKKQIKVVLLKSLTSNLWSIQSYAIKH